MSKEKKMRKRGKRNMEYISGINRKQSILFPEVIDEYIEEDNPVQFIDVFVDGLDLKELGFSHAES